MQWPTFGLSCSHETWIKVFLSEPPLTWHWNISYFFTGSNINAHSHVYFIFHVAIILVLMSRSCKLRDDRQGKVSWLPVAIAVPQLVLPSLFCVWWEFNGNAFINLLLLRPLFMLFRKKEQPLYSGKTLAAPGRGDLCPPNPLNLHAHWH